MFDKILDEAYSFELDSGDNLQYDDVQEIIRLLNHPVRSRHTCVSKGQLHTVIDQLIAHNVMLEKQVKQLKRELGNE